MTEAKTAAIALGSNMGDKAGYIRAALEGIEKMDDTRLISVSRFFQTEPVGYKNQDWFINAAALVETRLGPRELLAGLLALEKDLGRVRTTKWGPRTIDLDILFYDAEIVNETDLVLPHPLMQFRLFVLIPLKDIAPDWVHPLLDQTPPEMIKRLAPDGQEVTAAWE